MAENQKGFPPKGLQSAAHRLCTPMAHKVHTCSLKSIFSHAHVVRENNFTFLPPAGGKLCEAFFDTLQTGNAFRRSPCFYISPAGALSIGIWMISSRRRAAYSSVRAVPPGRPSNAAMRMREASTM